MQQHSSQCYEDQTKPIYDGKDSDSDVWSKDTAAHESSALEFPYWDI